MSIEQYMEEYTSSERETFQRACRRLLKQTFIVRDRNEESRKLYFFISKNPAPLSEYFQLIGFDIVVDRHNGHCRRQSRQQIILVIKGHVLGCQSIPFPHAKQEIFPHPVFRKRIVCLLVAIGRARFLRNREVDERGNIEQTIRYIVEEMGELDWKEGLPKLPSKYSKRFSVRLSSVSSFTIFSITFRIKGSTELSGNV